MTFQTINFGAASDGSQGDTVRTAFTKMNTNLGLALEATVAASTYLAKASDGGLQATGKILGVNKPNLLANGSGELSNALWASSNFAAALGGAGEGAFFQNPSAITTGTFLEDLSNAIAISAGIQISLSAEINTAVNGGLTAGSVYVKAEAFNSGGASLGEVCRTVAVSPVQPWTYVSGTGVTPANTASIRIHRTADLNPRANAFGILFRRIKVELGTLPSLYSDEANAAAFMDLYNTQTIAGAKTFSGSVSAAAFGPVTSTGSVSALTALGAYSAYPYTNASFITASTIPGLATAIVSAANGTGPLLPLSFYVGSTSIPKLKLLTTGEATFGFGDTAPIVTGAGVFNFGSASYNLALRNTAAASGKCWLLGPLSSNNMIVFNQNLTGCYIADGTTAWAGQSDERLKNIRSEITGGLAAVNSLRAVRYSWRAEDDHCAALGVENDSRVHVGVIAQDIQKVLPEAVSTADNGYLGVAMTDIIPLALAAIKELSAELEAVRSRLAVLEAA